MYNGFSLLEISVLVEIFQIIKPYERTGLGTLFFKLFSEFVNKKKCKAVCRGHGSQLRKRLESQLNKKIHEIKRLTNHHTVCMKLIGNNQGVDINELPLSTISWHVIQHSMPNSSVKIGEQAKIAFENVYDFQQRN